MAISSPGVGSNLDVQGIVTKLMAVEQQPLTKLTQKEASYQARLSGWGSLKGALSGFQSAVSSLNSTSKFTSVTASVGDSSVASATAFSTAKTSSHSLEVSKLAQSQTLRTDFTASSLTDPIGTGDLTFYFGTYDSGGNTFTLNPGVSSKTVTVDATNNSLSGLRDAINDAGMGVTASIINDGTTNRLVLTSNNTGLANSMKIVANDTGDGNNTDMVGLSQLAYDPTLSSGAGKNMVQTVAAQNAEFTVDGIAMSKASNTVSDAIQGVNLTLNKTNVGSPTTVAVSKDTAGITSAVNDFVTAFNDLNTTITSLTAYDKETKQTGLLQGDSGILSIQSQLRTLMTRSVASLDGGTATLNDVGITFQKDGSLALDSSKLQNAVNTNPDRVMGLFASAGKGTDSLVNYSSYSSSTQAGTYAVNVTQLATQGNLVGGQAASLTITAGINDELSMTVDGVAATINISAGTYTADSLAAEVQAKLNGSSAFSSAGVGVAITQNAGVFTIASNRYGSASTVSAGGNAALTLLGAGRTATNGVDVAGTIGGYAATGSGQVLTGTAGGSSGLKIEVAGGTTGDRGTVTFAQGFAYRLSSLVDSFMASDGVVATRSDGINRSIDDLTQRQETLQKRLDTIQQRYYAQFSALDTLISGMQTTSNFLTQQLSALASLSAGK